MSWYVIFVFIIWYQNEIKVIFNLSLCTLTVLYHLRKADYVYVDISQDVEKWFDTSNYDVIHQIMMKEEEKEHYLLEKAKK